jgi:3-oxoacyl-[acyl-carrier protein] reductase
MKGRVVLVTGAARGVGAAIARAFGRAGAKVAVNFRRSKAEAEAVARECGGACFRADVSREAGRLVAAVVRKYGGLDVLVNNAGASIREAWSDDLDAVTEARWKEVIGTDLKGAFECARAAAKVMDRGKIINVASIPAMTGEREGILYAIAKAGVLGMTKSLAVLLAPRVQVNAMALGSIETGWTDWLGARRREEYRRAIPLGRFGRPEEVAELALFLAGNDFVTGQTLVLDGGEARV